MIGSLIVIAGCGSLGSTLPPGCTNSTLITVGDTVRTSYGVNSCKEADGTYVDFYNLALTAQTNLVISMYAPGLKVYVMVYDQNRTPIVSSTVTAAPDSTASVRLILTAATYQIAIRDSVPGQTGAYRMSASVDPAPAAGCGLIWIVPGVTTTQTLTNADCTASSGGTTHYYHHYEMAMLFSQSNVFTETSSAFNPSMTLFTSQGAGTNSTLDGTGSIATISAFAQAQDYYQLWVGTVSALQTGSYTLNVK